MECSSIAGYISHTKTSNDAIGICSFYIPQCLFVFRNPKCWYNNFIAYFEIVNIRPIKIFVWIRNIKKHFCNFKSFGFQSPSNIICLFGFKLSMV